MDDFRIPWSSARISSPPLVAEWILILFDVRPLKQVGLDELYNTLNRDIWKCVRPLPSNA